VTPVQFDVRVARHRPRWRTFHLTFDGQVERGSSSIQSPWPGPALRRAYTSRPFVSNAMSRCLVGNPRFRRREPVRAQPRSRCKSPCIAETPLTKRVQPNGWPSESDAIVRTTSVAHNALDLQTDDTVLSATVNAKSVADQLRPSSADARRGPPVGASPDEPPAVNLAVVQVASTGSS
jgi:hypothetical protein